MNPRYRITLTDEERRALQTITLTGKIQRPCLALDNNHAMELLLRDLVSLGHRRVAYIGGYPGVNDSIERRRAFHSFRRTLNLQWKDEWEQCGEFSWGWWT
jgi:DNA-binding LacI/PurR family transcriptional regulator